MIAVLQRVQHASVVIEGIEKANIQAGLLVLLGITHQDTEQDIHWLAKKIVNLRIFNDADGRMNLDVKTIQGDILLVSQFTLHASTKKGNRPSFTAAAPPALAIPLYEKMIQALSENLGKPIFTGKFGADMKITLLNDGPVTILIDTKNPI